MLKVFTNRIYKKAMAGEKKREVKYQVMTKGRRGAASRPSGPYRVVDKRLKKVFVIRNFFCIYSIKLGSTQFSG